VSTSGSRAWHVAFKLMYRILALIDPLVRVMWRRFGIGNVVELEVASRRTPSTTRRRLVGVLRAGEERYVGHPNGDVGWTRDLAAAESGTIHWPEGSAWKFTATRLTHGDERERAIRATGQHPFPGNLIYRLGRRHIRAVGVFFRLTARA
jgi:hypothetical protein